MRFVGYERDHQRTARWRLRSMGNRYDGTDAGGYEMMAARPMVVFSERVVDDVA